MNPSRSRTWRWYPATSATIDSRTRPAPALAVEVAVSSLTFDRTHKASLYARAGVADYWIVNLVDRVVEVYRQPAPDSDAPFGWAYVSAAVLIEGDAMVPLAAPASSVSVTSLLP